MKFNIKSKRGGLFGDPLDFIMLILIFFLLFFFFGGVFIGGTAKASSQFSIEFSLLSSTDETIKNLRYQLYEGADLENLNLDLVIKNSRILSGKKIEICADYGTKDDCSNDFLRISTKGCYWDSDNNVCKISQSAVKNQLTKELTGEEKFHFCDNKCTTEEKDCTGKKKETFDKLKDCMKKIRFESKVIFIPVNWNGEGMSTWAKQQFDYYQNFYNAQKEAVYLSENCVIPEFDKEDHDIDPAVANKGLEQCAKKKFSKHSDDKNILVGVVKTRVFGENLEGYEYNRKIFLVFDSDKFTLAHEVGHRDFNYCEEYKYGGEWELKKEPEEEVDTELSFEKHLQEEFKDALKVDPKAKLDFSPDKSKAIISVNSEAYKGKGNYRMEGDKIIFNLDLYLMSDGWKKQNLMRGCPNRYPSCCIDSPKWPQEGWKQDVNPYGPNCYPNSLRMTFEGRDIHPGKERYDIIIKDLCNGGPCKDSKSDQCRSIMGPAGTELEKGWPMKK